MFVRIFVSFAKAFKRPQEGKTVTRSPQSQHEEEHIVMEVLLLLLELLLTPPP